jgi:adenosine deaminase
LRRPPAYIGSDHSTRTTLDLNVDDIFTLAKNAFTASFPSNEEKERYIAELDHAMN